MIRHDLGLSGAITEHLVDGRWTLYKSPLHINHRLLAGSTVIRTQAELLQAAAIALGQRVG